MNKTKYQFGGLVNIIKTAINGPAKPPIRKMKPIGPYKKMGPLEPDIKTTYGPYNLPGVTVTALNLSKPQRFPYGGINVVSKPINGGLDYRRRIYVNPFEGHDLVQQDKQQSHVQREKLYQSGGSINMGPKTKLSTQQIITAARNTIHEQPLSGTDPVGTALVAGAGVSKILRPTILKSIGKKIYDGVMNNGDTRAIEDYPTNWIIEQYENNPYVFWPVTVGGLGGAGYSWYRLFKDQNARDKAATKKYQFGGQAPAQPREEFSKRITKFKSPSSDQLMQTSYIMNAQKSAELLKQKADSLDRAYQLKTHNENIQQANQKINYNIPRVPATAPFKGDVKKHQFGGELVDTRSDTTYKGYNPNPVPWNAGNGAAGQGPLIVFDYLEDKSKTTNNPYMQTGAPPVLPAFGGPMMLENGTLMNYVTNPAEQAARSDFLHTISRTEHGARAIAGSGKIPKGTISEDWQLPKVFKYETQVTPVYKGNPTINTTTKVSIPARTSKFEDRIDGINGKTRSQFNNAASMEAEDARIVRSGNTRLNRERMRLAEQQIRQDADYNPLYEKLVKKREMAAPQNRAQWEKKIRELLKEFIEKRGLH